MGASTALAYLWGASYANTLYPGFLPDKAVAWSEPREGSDFAKVSSGVEDSWIVGTDELLALDHRWIPAADITDPVVATGWDGATGWRAFLAWARAKNIVRVCPDAGVLTSYQEIYLVDPMKGEPPQESDGTRKLRLTWRDANDTAFTGF